jgi:hypothetical protein
VEKDTAISVVVRFKTIKDGVMFNSYVIVAPAFSVTWFPVPEARLPNVREMQDQTMRGICNLQPYKMLWYEAEAITVAAQF